MRITTLILTAILVLVTGCSPDSLITDQSADERTSIGEFRPAIIADFTSATGMTVEEAKEAFFEQVVYVKGPIASKSAALITNLGVVGSCQLGDKTSWGLWASVRDNFSQVFVGMFGMDVDANGLFVEEYLEAEFSAWGRFACFMNEIQFSGMTTPYIELTFEVGGFDQSTAPESFEAYVYDNGTVVSPKVKSRLKMKYDRMIKRVNLGAFDTEVNAKLVLPQTEQTAWLKVYASDIGCSADSECSIHGYLSRPNAAGEYVDYVEVPKYTFVGEEYHMIPFFVDEGTMVTLWITESQNGFERDWSWNIDLTGDKLYDVGTGEQQLWLQFPIYGAVATYPEPPSVPNG